MRILFISRLILLLTLFFPTGSVIVTATPKVIPQKQAAHFCQLFINDGKDIFPLSYHAHRVLTPTDSLRAEQQFISYLFLHDNWQVLRIFPHLADDGTVNWYAPADDLPASLGTEHQKYIREVLPRLQREIVAENWPVVDDCIDKMIRYQCQFGGSRNNYHLWDKSKFFDQIVCYIKEKLYLCIVILKRVTRKGVLNCT